MLIFLKEIYLPAAKYEVSVIFYVSFMLPFTMLPISVAFAAIAPVCTRFLCWIYGFVESISTGDHRQPQAGGTKFLEAALLMLPAGKCFRAEASGQNWEQRDPTRWLWWLFLVVASMKPRKSLQTTNIVLREKFRDSCTATVSNHLRYLLGLVVFEKKGT